MVTKVNAGLGKVNIGTKLKKGRPKKGRILKINAGLSKVNVGKVIKKTVKMRSKKIKARIKSKKRLI